MKKFGFSTLTSILCIAGASAIGVAGYTTFSGQTLCSVMAGCDGKTVKSENAKAVNVASKTDAKSCSTEKSCCALAKLAKADSIAACDAKATTCKTACKTATVQARNLQAVVLGSAYPIAIPAAFYDRNASMDCSALKASGCCKSGAKAVNASTTEKSGCCKSGAKAVDASATEKSGCCKSGAKAVDASATEKSGCCKSGAKAVDASATEKSGCCKSKDAAAATAINASATNADEGCCKGSGKRADGKECCGKCPSKSSEKVADSSN